MVASNGFIGGFSGQWGTSAPKVKKKISLLIQEGVMLDRRTGIVSRASMYTFPQDCGQYNDHHHPETGRPPSQSKREREKGELLVESPAPKTDIIDYGGINCLLNGIGFLL